MSSILKESGVDEVVETSEIPTSIPKWAIEEELDFKENMDRLLKIRTKINCMQASNWWKSALRFWEGC